MVVREGGDNEFSLDTWVALLAGSSPWVSDEQSSSAWSRLLSFIEAIAVVSCIGTIWQSPNADARFGPPHLAAIFATVALGLLLIYPLLRLTHHRPWSKNLAVNLITRTSLFGVLCISIYAALPGWQVLWSTGFALAVGIDAWLTCLDLGWPARPFVWYRNFLRSGFHLGIVGALIATFVVPHGTSLGVEIPLYVCLQVWLGLALCTVWLAGYIHRGEQIEQQQAIAEVIEGERRLRAHWLHDDVCAQLRLVSLKVQTDGASREEIVRLLDEFDHQLRLRQLDELFGAGSVRVAELLQPYIRDAQNHGVNIDRVPGFDQAAVVLSEDAARLFARAANVLTSNALNSGARTISYDVSDSANYLRLSISDDGPGFSLSDVPHGRGLWTLIDDLKPGGIEIQPSESGGATVIASVPHQKRSDRGQHLARR